MFHKQYFRNLNWCRCFGKQFGNTASSSIYNLGLGILLSEIHPIGK